MRRHSRPKAWWLVAAVFALTLFGQPVLAQTVTVTVNAPPNEAPLAIDETGTASLCASASLSTIPPYRTVVSGPVWSWTVVSVVPVPDPDNPSMPDPSEAHAWLSGTSSDSAEATLNDYFDTNGEWAMTVQAQATFTLDDGSTFSGTGTATVNGEAADNFGFRPKGDIVILNAPHTSTTAGSGTLSLPNTKVFPGQNLLLQLAFDDPDEARKNGGAYETFRAPLAWKGDYSVKIKLTNAKFTGGTDTEKTLTATRIGAGRFFLAGNDVAITTADPWAGDVKVVLEVTDTITIPDTVTLETGGTVNDLRDAVTTLTITWGKATAIPTTMDAKTQKPPDIGDTVTTNTLQVWYQFGPGPHPAYVGTPVMELFGACTSNLALTDLTPALQATHDPAWTLAQWNTYFFNSGNNVTFAIGTDDYIVDSHGGAIFGGKDPGLTAAGKGRTIYFDLPQTYQCPPGTAIGKAWTIRRQRTKDAEFQMRKWSP
jgi:hypothetical protein